MGILRLGKKVVGSVKRFGNKHAGKIAVIGAVAGAGAKAHYDSGEDDRNRAEAGRTAERLMNEDNDNRQKEAEAAHNKLLASAKPAPKGKGNIGNKAKDPNILQVAGNIPKALKKAEKVGRDVEGASLLRKGKKIETGVNQVLGELNQPSKKEQKRVSEEDKFLQGGMSDAEARAYIEKKGGKKKKSKKAKKQAKKRKEKKYEEDPKYKKGAGKKGGYDF